MSAGYAALAVVALTSPATVAEHGPITSGPMGIRFAGAWAAFLALLAGYAAVRSRAAESRAPLLGLVVWPLAILTAALVHYDELRSEARMPYVAALAVLAALASGVAVVGRATVAPPLPRTRTDALGASAS